MDKIELYKNTLEKLKSNDLCYLSWGYDLDPIYPTIQLMKDYFSQYKFRILVICDSVRSKLRLLELFSNSGLVKYQLDKIDFMPYYSDFSNYSGDPKDLIICYNLYSLLIVDDIKSIIKLRDVSAYNKPKIIFLDKKTDYFIKKEIENSNLTTHINCLTRKKDKNNIKLFLHPIKLGTNRDDLYVWSSKYLRENPNVINLDYSEFVTKDYSHRYNTIINVTCSQSQKYALLSKEIEECKRDATTVISEKSDAIAFKNKLLIRKNYLASLKNSIVKDFIKDINDVKFAIFVSNIDQANYLGFNYCLDASSNEEMINSTILKFNANIYKDICLKTTVPDTVNIENVNSVVFTCISGNEEEIIDELLALDDKICHIFYFKYTYEDVVLHKMLSKINSDVYYELDD